MRSSGDGGGTGVVTADLVTEAGLELPTLSPELASRLIEIAPTIVTANPVDLAGAGEQDFWNFERVNAAVLGSGEVDAVVFTGYFGGYSQLNETDTYEFSPETSAADLIEMIIKRFRTVWKPDWSDKARLLNRTPREVVTVASIIETEAKLNQDRPLVASVIYNRLRLNIPLAVDSAFNVRIRA